MHSIPPSQYRMVVAVASRVYVSTSKRWSMSRPSPPAARTAEDGSLLRTEMPANRAGSVCKSGVRCLSRLGGR